MLTSIVPVTFYVPPGVCIGWVILLVARDLDLLETPWRQRSAARAHIAPQPLVSESDPSRQRTDVLDVLLAAGDDIVCDLDDPVVIRVAACGVAVPTDLIVELGDGSWEGMGVHVAAGRVVLESDHVAVADVLYLLVRVILGLIPTS